MASEETNEYLTNVECPNKQLWNLLLNPTTLVSEELVHEELKRAGKRVLSCLTYYISPPINVPTITNKKDQNNDGKDKGTESVNFKEKLNNDISKHLKLESKVAWELFCSYMMFEYKGGKTTYAKLIENPKVYSGFLDDLKKFYIRERLCLIYCSQVILANALDDIHPYNELLLEFIKATSLNEWCESLCKSLDLVDNEYERIELNNTLCILLFNYSNLASGDFLDVFTNNYTFEKSFKKSSSLQMSEALIFFILLNSGDIKSESENSFIMAFFENSMEELGLNNFVFPAYLASIPRRCKGNAKISNKIRGMSSTAKKCANIMTQIADVYTPNNYKDRHRLSSIIFKCLYQSMDLILQSFIRENFGSMEDWFKLFSSLLKSSEVSKVFLIESSDEMQQLYYDALYLFPIDVSYILDIWGSICYLATPDNPSSSIIKKLHEINVVSELMENIDSRLIRAKGTHEFYNIMERTVAGIRIKENSVGILIGNEEILAWKLSEPSNKSFWEVINYELINPILQDPNKISLEPNLEKNIFAIADFLIVFSTTSPDNSNCPNDIAKLYSETCQVLLIISSTKNQFVEKGKVLGKFLDVVRAGSKYNLNAQDPNQNIWPSVEKSSIIGDFIMTYESVASSNYNATKSLLKTISSFLKDMDNRNLEFGNICLRSLCFIIENIMFSYRQWRIQKLSDKFELLKDILNFFDTILNLNEKWIHLIDFARNILFEQNSPIKFFIEIDEDSLQESIILPNDNNHLFSSIVCLSFSILSRVVKSNNVNDKKIKDNKLSVDLIQKLAVFARHRLHPSIPILAMNILRKISEDMPKSFLGSLGKECESFREVVLQRLEYGSEDLELKIVILEFLTSCCHTQPGLTHQFFVANGIIECLLDLFMENNERLSIALLGLFRAILCRGAEIINKCKVKDIWTKIFIPIKQIKRDSDLKLIEYTNHIISFELFTNGLTEPNFKSEIAKLLDKEEFLRNFKIIMTHTNESEKEKSILAIKHLLIIITSKPELEQLVTEESKHLILDYIQEEFWGIGEETEGKVLIKGSIAEILLLLSPWQKEDFLHRLMIKFIKNFETKFVAVQLPILSLINKSILKATSPIESITLECIVRIISKIFDKAGRIFDMDNTKHVTSILSIALGIASSIVTSPNCQNWEPLFAHHFLVNGILSIAYSGISKEVGPVIVMECVAILITIAESQKSCELLRYVSLSKYLWLPLAKYATPEMVDTQWNQVYALCLYLNACMIRLYRFYYIEECLNFWGLHGLYIAHKLWSVTDVINRCQYGNPDANFKEITQMLSFVQIVLYSIYLMKPFLKEWNLKQGQSLERILEGVFSTLRSTVSLLSQPNQLHTLVSKRKGKHDTADFKLTPQLLEIQAKLWNTIFCALQIFSSIKEERQEYIDNNELLSTLNRLISVCIKALTKGDKRLTNISSNITLILEKSLDLYLYRGKLAIDDPDFLPKEMAAKKREIANDIAVHSESVKRLALGNSYLDLIYVILDDVFK